MRHDLGEEAWRMQARAGAWVACRTAALTSAHNVHHECGCVFGCVHRGTRASGPQTSVPWRPSELQTL